MRAPPREHEDLRKAARQVDTDQRDSLKRYLRASRQGAAAFPARLPRCTHDDDVAPVIPAAGLYLVGRVWAAIRALTRSRQRPGAHGAPEHAGAALSKVQDARCAAARACG